MADEEHVENSQLPEPGGEVFQPPEVVKRSPPKPKARLTVTETVYHYVPDREAPFTVTSRFGGELNSAEYPLIRNVLVGEQWTPLPEAWLQIIPTCGMLVLRNDGAEVVEAGVLSRGVVHPFGIIPPGMESARLKPYLLSSLRLRGVKRSCKVMVAIFPE